MDNKSNKKTRTWRVSWMLPDYLGCSFGGGKRDRTDDLLHAMQALSQLSYTPKESANYTEG